MSSSGVSGAVATWRSCPRSGWKAVKPTCTPVGPELSRSGPNTEKRRPNSYVCFCQHGHVGARDATGFSLRLGEVSVAAKNRVALLTNLLMRSVPETKPFPCISSSEHLVVMETHPMTSALSEETAKPPTMTVLTGSRSGEDPCRDIKPGGATVP